jgi:hypothetical protein
MKRAAELFALAQRQRTILIEWLLDELREDGLSDTLLAAVDANDELIRVLRPICGESDCLHDGAG